MPGVSLEQGTISCDARYRLDAPTDIMVLAGAMALSLSRMFGGSAQATSMQRLLERLTGGARRRIVDAERKFYFVERGGEVALDSPEHALDEISEAVRDSLEVTATYTSNEGSPERLQIRPLTILVYQHQFYVLALTPARKTPSLFRVARMGHIEPVRLTGHWARYARSHLWHKTQTLRAEGSACIVSLRVRVCPELESWVLSLGELGEVVAPAELRARAAQRFAAACQSYATGSAPAAIEGAPS